MIYRKKKSEKIESLWRGNAPFSDVIEKTDLRRECLVFSCKFVIEDLKFNWKNRHQSTEAERRLIHRLSNDRTSIEFYLFREEFCEMTKSEDGRRYRYNVSIKLNLLRWHRQSRNFWINNMLFRIKSKLIWRSYGRKRILYSA